MFLLETYVNLQETLLVFGKLLKTEIFCLHNSTGRLYEKVNCTFSRHKLHFIIFVVVVVVVVVVISITLKGIICLTNLRQHTCPENKQIIFNRHALCLAVKWS